MMTFAELGARLAELENARAVALSEMETIRGCYEGVERLERDRDALLETYSGSPLEALESLEPEERRTVYEMLRLEVLVGTDGSLTINSIPGEAILTLGERPLHLGVPGESPSRARHLWARPGSSKSPLRRI